MPNYSGDGSGDVGGSNTSSHGGHSRDSRSYDSSGKDLGSYGSISKTVDTAASIVGNIFNSVSDATNNITSHAVDMGKQFISNSAKNFYQPATRYLDMFLGSGTTQIIDNYVDNEVEDGFVGNTLEAVEAGVNTLTDPDTYRKALSNMYQGQGVPKNRRHKSEKGAKATSEFERDTIQSLGHYVTNVGVEDPSPVTSQSKKGSNTRIHPSVRKRGSRRRPVARNKNKVVKIHR
jgi:hypothetical protein